MSDSQSSYDKRSETRQLAKMNKQLSESMQSNDDFDLAFRLASKTSVGSIEDQIEKSLRLFMINGKEHKYSPEDFIFTLSRALDIKYRRLQDSCIGCDVPIKAKSGKLKWCEFCGKNVCKACRVKRRCFPQDKGRTGKCCIVCDRKFYIDELFAEFRTILANIKNEEDGMKMDIKYREGVYNKINKDFEELVHRHDLVSRKFNDQITSKEYKIEALKEGLKNSKKEKQQYMLSINEIDNEITDLEHEIKELAFKKVDVDRSILDIDEKRTRYDQEIKEMRELIKTDYSHTKRTRKEAKELK